MRYEQKPLHLQANNRRETGSAERSRSKRHISNKLRWGKSLSNIIRHCVNA